MQFNDRLNQPQSLLTRLYDYFLKLVVYPSIWVASAIASLVWFAQMALGLETDGRAILLVFSAALIPYNIDRIFDSYVQRIPESKLHNYFRQPSIFILLIVAIITTAILLHQAPARVRTVSYAGIIPLLYGVPFFPWFRNGELRWYRLKDIPTAKAWIVGATLTYATVAVPMAYTGANFTLKTALTTLFVFIFIVTNSHAFDIRDIESDQAKGVMTLPRAIGVCNTRIFLTALNLAMLLVVTWGWQAKLIDFYLEAIVGTGVTLFYLWKVRTNMQREIYDIAIDGFLFMPALCCGLLVALQTTGIF